MAQDTENRLQRYVPLLCWLIAILTLLLIPLKIVSYGFLPGGDARRHVAKAFTDKTNAEIMVLAPEYTVDQSKGWDWLLHVLRHRTGWSEDALMSFSVVTLMLCVFWAALPWMRQPEAWLAAILAEMLAIPEVMTRWSQARPYLLTEGILIAILLFWTKPGAKKASPLKLGLTTAGFALSTYMHGPWYLWFLVLAAFFLAGAWWEWLWLSVTCVAGILIGACLTGSPIGYLWMILFTLLRISGEHTPSWMLVGEFQPSFGEFSTLSLVAVVYLWRRQQLKAATDPARKPVVWLIVICWILSFRADRFWSDWGMPAAVVWLALQFEEITPTLWTSGSLKRLAACALIAAPLYFHATNDLDRRYTRWTQEQFLDSADPNLQGWFPGPGGIIYSAQMETFYNTFYQNPRGNWRYVLSIEPALMPPDDLKIFRNIQLHQFAAKAYQPWADKLRSIDRLVIPSYSQPDLPALEWRNAGGTTWIGRRKN